MSEKVAPPEPVDVDTDVAPTVRLEPASAWCASGEPLEDAGTGVSGIHCLAPLDIATGTGSAGGVTWEAGPIHSVGQ